MSKPILITCQPDDQYFIWQNHLYIESCIQRGFTPDQIHILLYKPIGRVANSNWDKLKEIYPGLSIFLYEDQGVQKYLSLYVSIIRPHILYQHFKKFPDLETKTIIYTDSDILWLPSLDIEKYFDDSINYISDASSYMNFSYFESKKKDVLEGKREQFEKLDFLKEICNEVGIDKRVIIDNNNNTGGVQYILKNIPANFWKKVEQDILKIRIYFMDINKQYFKSENAGIQSWCADLWAVQWNLWYFNQPTRVVKEMDFAWSSDSINKLSTTGILHNAGITDPQMGGAYPAFYKGSYHTGKDPFEDPHLQDVLNNETSQKHCTHYYLQQLLELKEKYNIKY